MMAVQVILVKGWLIPKIASRICNNQFEQAGQKDQDINEEVAGAELCQAQNKQG